MKIYSVGVELFNSDGQTDRQTDRMNITVAFWRIRDQLDVTIY